MKTFTYADYNDKWPVFINDFNEELKTLNLPIKFTHRIYGSGTITFVRAKLVGSDLELVLTYENKKKTPDIRELRSFLELEFLSIDNEADLQSLLEAQSVLRAVYDERVNAANTKAQQEAEARRRQQLELERRNKERKAKEAAERRIKRYNEKLAERMTRDTAHFQADESEIAPFSPTAELYYSLGWLAKHIGSVSAALPKWLGPEFERHFGSEAPKTLKEGLTSGGHEMQRDYSFKCSLVKLKSTTIPAYLQTYVTEDNKGIHNTKFIWNLVDNYGFCFGKTQDVSTIKSTVPTTYLTYFEAGFAA